MSVMSPMDRGHDPEDFVSHVNFVAHECIKPS
jgi:hypothetical protein